MKLFNLDILPYPDPSWKIIYDEYENVDVNNSQRLKDFEERPQRFGLTHSIG